MPLKLYTFCLSSITLFGNLPKNKMKKYVKRNNLHINETVILSSNDCSI